MTGPNLEMARVGVDMLYNESAVTPSCSTQVSAKSVWLHIRKAQMRVASIGKCASCGVKIDKADMKSHIITCAKTTEFKGKAEKIIQLFIEAEELPEYWVYLEGNEQATFQELDGYLRHIWLECCDHLSGFFEMRNQIPKGTRLVEYFAKPGMVFKYKYDFETTTELLGKSINLRKGSIGKQTIRLLARNEPLKLACSECKKPAEYVCPFCIDVMPTLFCAAHAEKHKCGVEETYLPVVNSPRMGICKYTGGV
ncbi:MAG: hypothetical protein EHM12_07065 [Dehalococcoidia bacterium]|nr:MAG: hypothetical protein EHM12_07065 [Dehalococcoidia bacterium]